jgi:hypothetical protein
MIGIEFSAHTLRLNPVPAEVEKPIDTIVIPDNKKKAFQNYMESYYSSTDFKKVARHMHYDVLSVLGKESVAKISHSTTSMMCDSVEDKFKHDPELRLYYKIKSSMWRWGMGRGSWNEIADVYNQILSFDLGVDGFDVALDYTTSVNEKGRTEHSRKYIDGVFAYNVHHKGEHVLTIGFSVVSEYKVFVQQVQNVKPKGNRWRFKLPENLLEHVIDRFKAAFPQHEIYISDAEDQVNETIASYQRGLERAEKHNWEEDIAFFRSALENIIARKESIIDFYCNTGKYTRDEEKTANGFRHYKLILTN